MPRDEDGERPKKSWREIDQQRDRSVHRKEGSAQIGPSSRVQRSQAYRSYRSQLNKLFDGGVVPDALKSKLAGAEVATDAHGRKQDAAIVLAAASAEQLRSALDAYRAKHGFPEQEELLTRLLDLPDDGILGQVLAALSALQAEGKVKRKSSLKARLKTVQMTATEPEIQSAARVLIAQL